MTKTNKLSIIMEKFDILNGTMIWIYGDVTPFKFQGKTIDTHK